MANSSQNRAIRNYRDRLHKRGLTRFEVLGRAADRGLIRALARRLAEDGPDVARLRAAVSEANAEELPRGGILDALRRSPLVGANVAIVRAKGPGRKLDL